MTWSSKGTLDAVVVASCVATLAALINFIVGVWFGVAAALALSPIWGAVSVVAYSVTYSRAYRQYLIDGFPANTVNRDMALLSALELDEHSREAFKLRLAGKHLGVDPPATTPIQFPNFVDETPGLAQSETLDRNENLIMVVPPSELPQDKNPGASEAIPSEPQPQDTKGAA